MTVANPSDKAARERTISQILQACTVILVTSVFSLNFIAEGNRTVQSLNQSGPYQDQLRHMIAASSALAHDLESTKQEVQTLGTQYGNLYQTEIQDLSVVNQVNSQLLASGLTPVKIPGKPPVVKGFANPSLLATSTTPPPVQAITSAS